MKRYYSIFWRNGGRLSPAWSSRTDDDPELWGRLNDAERRPFEIAAYGRALPPLGTGPNTYKHRTKRKEKIG